MNSVGAALAAARAKLPASEARLLLGHVLGRAPAWLIAHDDDVLDEAVLQRYAALVTRRAGGEPAAYLLGYREFFAREFLVSPAVLIPRPETELLVEVVLVRLGQSASADTAAGGPPVNPVRILDLGTGSGCIAVTLALDLPLAQLSASDVSAAALELAQRNAERLGAKLRLLRSDWFDELGDERFDLIVSNPPYIAAADPHLRAGDLRHEPLAALSGGADGLAAIRRIVTGAPGHLAPGGQLWLEHGYDQAAAVQELLHAAGFAEIRHYPDLAGILRVSGGVRA